MLSRRAYTCESSASSWEEIWEAGPYYERISELLEDARHYAVFVGWQIDSRLPLKRPRRAGPETAPVRETLKQKVIRICESKPDFHVYFLVWDHAYFYVLERETWQGRIWDNVHPRVHFLFDNRHPFGGSHHEKICVIDGEVAFCGGIDLCDERWDSPQHLYFDPRRSLSWRREHHGPYHDLSVQVTGPICAELQAHVAERWRALSTIPFPDPPPETRLEPGTGHRVYMSRTIATVDVGFRGVPIVREIEFLFRDLIRSAKHRIILEGQYYWSRDVNDMLVSKVQEMKGQDFEVFIILAELARLKSLTRQMSRHELGLLESLEIAARQSGTKLVIGSPYVFPSADQGETGAPRPIYIHSKVVVIDDQYLSVGSANFAGRALRLDTEVNLTLEARNDADRAHIRKVAEGMLTHWEVAEYSDSHVAARQVRLRRYHPSAELRELERNSLRDFLTRRIPWVAFFDPVVPWIYPIAWRFRKLARSNRQLVAIAVFALWLAGALLAAALGYWIQPANLSRWSAIGFSVVLSSVWLLPIPFLLATLITLFRLGARTTAALVVASLWVAALWGYTATRLFPTPAASFYRRTGPRWLPAQLGLRSFPRLISVLADPRVSLRSKIVYQGLYSTPSPWFILGTLIFLPAATDVVVLWGGRGLLALCPPALRNWLHSASPILLLILLVGAVARLVARTWARKEWKTSF